MVKIIELRPNRKLLNSHFEKYQFCSDNIPIKNEIKLENEILHIELNTSQDSWLEAKLFAFHNHLFKNPYDSTCWFIDKDGQIWKFQIDGTLNLIFKSKCSNAQSSNHIYNPSIAFASKNIIVICNGDGTKEFLIENEGSIKSFLCEDVDPTVIFDARYIEESSKIIIALYKIDEDQGKKFSRLIFLFYNYDKNSKDESETIKLVQKQTLKVKGTVDYIYIEKNGKFADIISQNQVEFDYDSVNPIRIEKNDELNNSEIKTTKYYWSQDEDSLTLRVEIPENYNRVITKVEAAPTSLSILVGDMVLLKGETYNRLESELTTWKRKENTLEVELTKSESGLMWNELIKGDINGEYLPNEALAAEVHSRLSHLCSEQLESNIQDQPTIGFNSEQLEECDLSGAENVLQRICFNTHNTTHLAMLGSSRVLFVEKLPSGLSICLRYDHDGCFWLAEESDSEDWDFKHTHTFPAFGYVEASKTNKKFCISPSDRSHIAIVEHTRHVFIYEKPDDNAQIGKQRILDCGSEENPTLGIASVNKYLILLTKNTLYQFLVYS